MSDRQPPFSRHSVIAVIPALNPGPQVTEIVYETLKHCARLILVDDGCDEVNKKYLAECAVGDNVELVTFSENRGKGHALLAGLDRAMKHEPPYVLTLDSDGQHDPNDIPRFTELVRTSAEPIELVIGTRTGLDVMPIRSRVGNLFTARLFRMLTRRRVDDTQSGFRMLSARFARDVLDHVQGGRYETEMQILVRAVESNQPIGGVGIRTLYFDENQASQFRPVRDSLRVLSALAKYSGVALGSFLFDYAVFVLLTYGLGIHYLGGHVMGRILSGIGNFLANRRLVFQSTSGIAGDAVRYAGAVLLSMGVTALILFLLVDGLSVDAAVAKPIAEGMAFLMNFIVLSKVVFPDHRPRSKNR